MSAVRSALVPDRLTAERTVLTVALAAVCTGIGLAAAAGTFVPVLLALVAGIYAVLLVTRPVAALLGYAATRPIIDAVVHDEVGTFSRGQIWSAGLLLSIVAAMLLSPAVPRPRYLSPGLPILFLVVYAATTFWRAGASFAVGQWLRAVMWILFALAVERLARTAEGQRWTVLCGDVFAMLTAIVIALAIAGNRYGAAYYAHHFSSTGQSPHGLVELAVLVLPIVLLSLIRRSGRALAGALLAALCVEIVVSFVRTGYLALAVLVLGCAWLGLRRGRAGFAAIAAVAALATAVTAFALSDTIASRLSDLSNLSAGGQAERSAGAGRVGFWLAVTDVNLSGVSTVILGEGAATSIAINERINGQPAGSHNDFVEMFGTGGLVLLFAYLLMLTWAFGSFRRLRGDPRQSPAARDVGALGFVAGAAFVVLSFFNGIATSATALPFALFIGLARGMCATPGRTFLDVS